MQIRTFLACVSTALAVGVAGYAGYLYTEVDTRDDRADRAERDLSRARSDLEITRDELAAAVKDRDTAQADLAKYTAREAAASTLHNEKTLARNIALKFNDDARRDGAVRRLDGVSCIARNDDRTDFVCHVAFSDRRTATLRVTVSADGKRWISRGA